MPERDVTHLGAVFGNETGDFYKPEKERDGQYCIKGMIIYFKPNNRLSTSVEQIEIVTIE